MLNEHFGLNATLNEKVLQLCHCFVELLLQLVYLPLLVLVSLQELLHALLDLMRMAHNPFKLCASFSQVGLERGIAIRKSYFQAIY